MSKRGKAIFRPDVQQFEAPANPAEAAELPAVSAEVANEPEVNAPAFSFSKTAMEAPRRYCLKSGKWVAIGPEIQMPARPPHSPAFIVPSASQTEMAEIYANGCPLVTKN